MANSSLANAPTDWHLQTSTRIFYGNLLQAAATLERVAKGEVLDEKFDVDLIHQRLGNAMADALIWARVEFR